MPQDLSKTPEANTMETLRDEIETKLIGKPQKPITGVWEDMNSPKLQKMETGDSEPNHSDASKTRSKIKTSKEELVSLG